MRTGPSTLSLVCTIGIVCGNLLQSCGSTETHSREMSEGHSGSYVESAFGGSSRGSTWWERRHKRREDRDREREEERSSLGEGLYQTHQTMSGASRHRQFDERDEELEWLCRLVRDLELEARGRHWRKGRNNGEVALLMGENTMGPSPISPIPVDTGTDHIYENPVDVRTVHVHGSMQTGI